MLPFGFERGRYAIQMITSASLVAAKRKAKEVGIEDIKRVYLILILIFVVYLF